MSGLNIVDAESREFAADEATAFVENVWSSLNCRWVSRPSCIRQAQQKLWQLRLASELGFKIPKTLVTNDPEALPKFWEECRGQVIYKTIGRNQIRGEDGKFRSAYTNKLNADFLERRTEIGLAPCLFQGYAEKRVELRITVVGNRAFTCEIHSQRSERTRIDWRKYDIPNTPHLPARLPSDIEEKCLRLVRDLGLNFGAIDMIVTPEGDYVFVEINPNGQWLWIEQLTGLPIGDALFDLLTGTKPLT